MEVRTDSGQEGPVKRMGPLTEEEFEVFLQIIFNNAAKAVLTHGQLNPAVFFVQQQGLIRGLSGHGLDFSSEEKIDANIGPIKQEALDRKALAVFVASEARGHRISPQSQDTQSERKSLIVVNGKTPTLHGVLLQEFTPTPEGKHKLVGKPESATGFGPVNMTSRLLDGIWDTVH